MKQVDVPQDAAIFEQWHEIAYAVDEAGNYVLTPSAGWDAANLANFQAWQLIAEEIEKALAKVRSGAASPLLFHMVRNQMDVGLLSSYVGLSRWRVKRHLQAKHYQKLTPERRRKYAALFGIPVSDLDLIPERVELPVDLAAIKEAAK